MYHGNVDFDLSMLFSDHPFRALGIISFCLVCHQHSLKVYLSMKKSTVEKFSRLSHFSFIFSLLACVVLALSGFLAFGKETSGNIMSNFPKNEIIVSIAKLYIVANIFTTFPLECDTVHTTIGNFVSMTKVRAWVISAFVILGVTLVALFVKDLSAVLVITGVVSANSLGYIFPPAIWIKTTKKDYVKCIACIAFGIIASILAIFQ